MGRQHVSTGFFGTIGVVLALALIFIAAPIGLMMFACGGCALLVGTAADSTASTPRRTPSRRKVTVSEPPAAPSSVERVTLGNFYRIKSGMTLEQVKAILGENCELQIEAGTGGTAMHMVTWKPALSFGSSCNVTFQNGRVIAKGQFGLTGAATEPDPSPTPPESSTDDIATLADEASKQLEAEREQERQAAAEEAEVRAREDKAARTRVWKSPSGNFSLEAEFVRYSDGKVTLRKADESEIEVDLAKLSKDDRDWIDRRKATRHR